MPSLRFAAVRRRNRGRVWCLFASLLLLSVFALVRYNSSDDANAQEDARKWAAEIYGEDDADKVSGSADSAPHEANPGSSPKGKSKLGGNTSPQASLPTHTWGKDGLLVVNPDGEHPIYELIHNAEAKWADKHRRASKTLEQAVKEYERRYNRQPPIGFDAWWKYVVRNNVQLPDEYDQIYQQLEPYWGVDPAELILSESEHEKDGNTFTIGKSTIEDVLNVLNVALPPNRLQEFLIFAAKPQIELMSGAHKHIPPFIAVISVDDGPAFMMDWTWKKAALNAARMGKFLRREDLLSPDSMGFAAACPPGSPLYENAPLPDDQVTQRVNKTFIYDHRRAMDPCLHPEYLLLHSEFLKLDVDPIPRRFPPPTFSRSTTSLHADITVVSIGDDAEFEIASTDPAWEEKSEDRLVWRGKPSGMYAIRWRETQRARFVDLTLNETRYLFEDEEDTAQDYENITILPSVPRHVPVTEGDSWKRLSVNNATMNVAFTTDDPEDCAEELCELVDVVFGVKERLSLEEMGEHKYLIDLDSDGRSDGFRKLMSTNSLVFKATLYPEWYLDRIQPWVHYIPIQLDYSDLYNALTFFGGNIWGEGEHDESARKIALAGRSWVEKYWRKEDMVAYMFRLWLEYARVMNVDRETMNFQLPR